MVSAAFLFGIEVDFLISPYKGTFRVSQAYRNLRANGTYHQGYDLVGIGDKSIYCPVYGTVIRAGWECATLPKKGFGQRVVVRIGSTAYYMYFGHLSKINVAVGQKLKPGDLIGVEGSTGHTCIGKFASTIFLLGMYRCISTQASRMWQALLHTRPTGSQNFSDPAA